MTRPHAATPAPHTQALPLSDWFYLIKPVGGDLITVPHHGYLAVDQDTGEIAVFNQTEISQMHG